jgi:hypothetical protein
MKDCLLALVIVLAAGLPLRGAEDAAPSSQIVEPAPETVKLTAPTLSVTPCAPLASPNITAGLMAFLAPTEAERREVLAAQQVRYATDRTHRSLPEEFMLGGCVGWNMAPNPKYPKVVWVLQAGRERDAKFIEQHPEARFIVADERQDQVLTFRWLRLIDRDTCVAVVLGYSRCRWTSPESLAVAAQDLAERRRYLKSLTDAPILLAVSRVDAQERVNDLWGKAFAEGDPWDGYAFVGFSTFRGLREMGKQTICRQAGVPDYRPAIILAWHDAATQKGLDEDFDRTRQVWEANAGPFVQELLADGWKGFFMDLITAEQLWSRIDYLQPEVQKSR